MPYLYEKIHTAIAQGIQTRAGLDAAFPDVSQGSMGSAIRCLFRRGDIDRLGRGFYTLKKQPKQVAEHETLQDRILARLRKVRPLTARELSLCLDVARPKITDALTDLADASLVTWEPGGRAEVCDV